MSDTTSQSTDESIKSSFAMFELWKDIQALALNLPRDQKNKLTEKKNNIIVESMKLPNKSDKILTQILLCCVINPDAFAVYSRSKDRYKDAVISYRIFSENLAEHFSYNKQKMLSFPNNKNFFKFVSKEEKKFFEDAIDRLLKGVHKSFRSDKESAEALEVLIANAEKSLSFVINAANLRAKEEEDAKGLESAAGFFEGKASNYKTNAVLFLVGSAVFLGLIISLSFVFLEDNKVFSELSKLSANQETSKSFYFYLSLKMLFSSRMIMFVIFIAGFFSCLKFYAANNHNAIICDQRANTLKSFRTLHAASEEKNQKLVLRKILDSATAHQPTGFSKLQSDSGGANEVALLSKILPFISKQ